MCRAPPNTLPVASHPVGVEVTVGKLPRCELRDTLPIFSEVRGEPVLVLSGQFSWLSVIRH